MFVKGKSGNPRGRPKKTRALTEVLAAVCGNGKKKAIAEKVREGILSGVVTFNEAINPDTGKLGVRIIKLAADEWLQLVKFLYTQTDGPPPTKIEASGPDGGPIETSVESPEERKKRIDELISKRGE
jgi:hypothetical protein